LPKTWDEVITQFEIYSNSRYEKNARGLLELASRIKDHPDFKTMIPGVSLINLTLQHPNKKTLIYVWCEHPNQLYKVYLYDEKGSYDKVTVEDEAIIPTLLEYVSRVSRM
jgi:hypothetical protein